MSTTTVEWLTRQQVADLIGFTPKTLANWALEGRGPKFARVGGRCRYRKADVMAWQREQFGE